MGGVHFASMRVGSYLLSGCEFGSVWRVHTLDSTLLHTSKNICRAVGLLARYGASIFWLAVGRFEYFYPLQAATTKKG